MATDGHFLSGRCPSTIYSNNYSWSIKCFIIFIQFSMRECLSCISKRKAVNSFMVEMIIKNGSRHILCQNRFPNLNS